MRTRARWVVIAAFSLVGFCVAACGRRSEPGKFEEIDRVLVKSGHTSTAPRRIPPRKSFEFMVDSGYERFESALREAGIDDRRLGVEIEEMSQSCEQRHQHRKQR